MVVQYEVVSSETICIQTGLNQLSSYIYVYICVIIIMIKAKKVMNLRGSSMGRREGLEGRVAGRSKGHREVIQFYF